MSDSPSSETAPKRYVLAFLTNEWEWERALDVGTMDHAKAAAREALEAVVRDERPTLACVMVLEDGQKTGVWDWVAGQAYWSRL